jgi:heptosyltransferase-2
LIVMGLLDKETVKLDLDRAKRVLIRGVNWVGDTILTYPAVQNLKALLPQSHIAILVPEDLVDLWKTFPYIDEVLSFTKKKGFGSPSGDVRLGLSLKKRNFDLALILPRSFRSAWLAWQARIPVRIGYEDEGRSLFLTHGIPRTEDLLHIHRIHYYQRLIEPLGPSQGAPSPRIFLREEDRRWAEEKLGTLGLLDGRPLIGMNPGATYGLAKCWRPIRFGELGKRFFERWKASVLLFGKGGEGPITEEVLGYLGEGGIDLSGKTRLLQLAAILERCQLLVTNDTGTMHVAAAVGTPVVALFGSTDPITTRPWGDGHVVVRKEVSCSPCLKRVCPTGHRCMELITVDEVEEVVIQRLKKMEYEKGDEEVQRVLKRGQEMKI